MNKSTFLRPVNIDELCEALQYKKENSYTFFIAGGTDFVIRARNNKLMDYSIIDITAVEELSKIEKIDHHIEIGAAVTMDEIEKSDIVKDYAVALAQAASMVGSTQIRNRATIGGNIANAAHCADMITTCSALQAKVELLNAKGARRQVLVEDFTQGSGKTIIAPDEVLTKIIFPDLVTKKYTAFHKIGSRKSVTISKINCAARIGFEDDVVADISIYFGSIAPKAISAELLREHCVGKVWNEALLAELLELATETVDLAIPTRASRHYKRKAVKGVVCELYDKINVQRGDN